MLFGKRLLAVVLFALALLGAQPAMAQGCGQGNPNCIVPTAPFGTNNNQAASTAFVQQAKAGTFTGLSGDCTATSLGVITCLKTNGVLFGTLATAAPGTGVAVVGGNLNLQPSAASTLGGVLSKSCSTSNWFSALSTAGVFGCSQPNFTDLLGSLPNSQLAAMNSSTTKCNPTGGSAAPVDCTPAQESSVLAAYVGDTGSGGLKGAVPAPAAGDAAAGKTLGAGGSWSIITSIINTACNTSVTRKLCGTLFGSANLLWWGAVCDNATDTSTAIQNWLNDLPTTGPGYIPAGMPACIHTGVLLVSSNTTFRAYGATIKAANGSGIGTTGIHLTDVTWAALGPTNVYIFGLTYDGNRANRTPPGQAAGIYIINAVNYRLQDVTVLNAVADGVYAGGTAAIGRSVNGVWDHVFASAAFRNSGTVAGVDFLSIRDSIFQNAIGTSPESGLDVEPNNATDINTRLYISNSSFDGNHENGLNIICVVGAQCNFNSGGNNLEASGNGGFGFVATSTSSNFRWCNVNGTGNTSGLTSSVTDKCPP